jgi:hypothetical protein
MKIVKYVIKSNGVPLLFNPRMVHSDAINKGISAGFAIIDYDVTEDQFKVKCYGGSTSLQVASKEGDCSIIQNYLNELLCTMPFESIAAMQIF